MQMYNKLENLYLFNKNHNSVHKIMKTSIFFMFLGISTCFAAGSYSQTTLLSLDARDKTVIEIFSEIEKNSEYVFFYLDETLDVNKKVSITVENQTINTILDQLFADSNNKYMVSDRQVFISKKAAEITQQQTGIVITGTVKEVNGATMPGVSVMIKGATTGTVTDNSGKYSIIAPNKDAILVFSFIGYTSQESPVGNLTEINIVLIQGNSEIDEIVVVGYGVQKKINLSGAVESINSKSLANRSTNNVGMALQGLIPNMDVSVGGGAADATPSFNIRGETSINGGSPLILVDGIPTSASDFSRINSMDIENISVLKDASSAAIYGARAAFGVILVTTQKGKGEKLTVRFNNTYGIRTPTRMPKVVTDPYIQTSYKNIMGAPWYKLYTDEEVEYTLRMKDDPTLPSTIINSLNPNQYTYLASHDWYNDIFDDFGTSHSHNLSISGASKNATYYLGSEYYRENGLLHYNKDTYDRFNVRSSVELKPAEWLTVGNNTALTYYKYDKPVNFGSWMYNIAHETNSLIPTYNPDGSYTSQGAQLIGTLIEGGEYTRADHVINTQFTANIALIKDILNIKTDFTAKLATNSMNQWDSDKNIPYRDGPNGQDLYLGWENYVQRHTERSLYNMYNLYLDFHKDFGIHGISVVGGYSQEHTNFTALTVKKADMILETYPTPQLATGEMNLTEYNYSWAIRSAFYRLNYVINDKYIFETNGRYDGSSRFPKKNRFGFFPSVSAAWVISGENFFEPIKDWFSFAKLRVSYGSLGNQLTSSYYPYISTMSAYKATGNLVNGQLPMVIGAPGLVSGALTWEKVYTFNVGADVNFFKNRLSLSGDVYRRDTKDMLTKGKTLPSVLGTGEPQMNAADMKTIGWELSVLWRDQFNLLTKPFNYSTRFILSDSRSYITKFDNPTGYIGDYYVGKEIGEMWGLITDGFFIDQEDIDNHANQWDVGSYPGDRPWEPGDLKFRDVNEDGHINWGEYTLDDPGDYVKLGNGRNRYLYGLDLNADWNGFDLRVLIQGVGKKDWYPFGYKFSGIFFAPWGNVLENNLDHWTPENTDAYFPRLKSYIANGNGDISLAQTRYMQNAAYMRMKNITFGYSLPKTLVQKIKLENVRLYFSGENLFEITSLLKSYDPEGLNQTTHPFQRTYSFGLNITL